MCYSSCVSILIHCHLPLTCQIFSWISSFVRVQFHIQTKLWNNHYLIFYEDCVVESEIYLQMREDTAAIWLHVLCFHIQHRFLWKLFGRSSAHIFKGQICHSHPYIWIFHFNQGWDSTFCFSWSLRGGRGEAGDGG